MNKNKKYRLAEKADPEIGLYRIIALKDFNGVKKGEAGGWVKSEKNLSQKGDCWIYDDVKVFDDAEVYGDACVSGDALVYDNAQVYGDARVSGDARVYGDARVSEDAQVYDDACVYDNAQVYGGARVYSKARVYGKAEIGGGAAVEKMGDYLVFQNFWSSGRYFTWTRSNDMWTVGCFHGTGAELVKKAYQDSEVSGRNYKRAVDYVESVKKEG